MGADEEAVKRRGPGEMCKAGHPYVLMRDKRGWNRCRTCHNARNVREHPCPECGASTRNMTFCSVACAEAAQDRRRRKPRPCRECGTTFAPKAGRPGGRVFCSDRCFRATFARQAKVDTVACAQCGVRFKRRREFLRRSRRPFCGQACSRLFYSGRNSPMSREGITSDKRGRGWGKLAEGIRERDGFRCRRCGKPQSENGGRKLCVDHIIPWRMFADHQKVEANDPRNLAALCTACHSWKTAHAEQRWLRGDVLDFKAFEKALALDSAARAVEAV